MFNVVFTKQLEEKCALVIMLENYDKVGKIISPSINKENTNRFSFFPFFLSYFFFTIDYCCSVLNGLIFVENYDK